MGKLLDLVVITRPILNIGRMRDIPCLDDMGARI